MDEFIGTITRTSIFAGLSREDLARVAGKGEQGFGYAQGRRFMAARLVVSLVAVSVPWWRALGLIR